MSEQWMLDSINISFLSQSETGLHLHFQASYSKLLEGYCSARVTDCVLPARVAFAQACRCED